MYAFLFQLGGSFEPKQCNEDDKCWCVEPLTGKEILGTRKSVGDGEPNCSKDA